MTEDELKDEYEVDWMRDRIDTLEEQIADHEGTIDNRDDTIREQDLMIAQLKDEIKTLSESIQ